MFGLIIDDAKGRVIVTHKTPPARISQVFLMAYGYSPLLAADAHSPGVVTNVTRTSPGVPRNT
eukprot:scaffold529473_cov46-Prasinocladus_malaysianus.AAC.1